MEARDWKYQLCDCCSAPKALCWVFCVPCGTLCMQAAASKFILNDNTACCIACLLGIFLECPGEACTSYRMRKELNIKGNYIHDLLLSFCCGCCEAIVEWREAMTLINKHHDECFLTVCFDDVKPKQPLI